MNYINRLITLNEEVVSKHALPMLRALGMEENNDGILNRIMVSSKIGDEIPNGQFRHTYQTKGFMGMGRTRYILGSGEIELFPCMAMQIKTNKRLVGIPAAGLVVRLFRKAIERHMIFVLAHELRHYWQYYTNTAYTREGSTGAVNFMPYSMRWEEIDANEFAEEYLNSIKR